MLRGLERDNHVTMLLCAIKGIFIFMKDFLLETKLCYSIDGREIEYCCNVGHIYGDDCDKAAVWRGTSKRRQDKYRF